MQILKKLNENNFNEVAKLIQHNSIPQQLMSGSIKNQLKRYRHSYSTPASLELAKKHQQTAKLNFKPALKGRQQQLCGCCNLRVQGQQISICQSVYPPQDKQITNQRNLLNEFKLTSDVALYFNFIKSCIYFLIIHTLIHSIFNLYSTLALGGYCESLPLCTKYIWNSASSPNLYDKQDLLQVLDILNLVAIIISVMFFAINRRRQYTISRIIDNQTQSEDDFTILISNIPILQFPKKGQQGKKLEFFYRKHLQQYFQKIISTWLKQKAQWQTKSDKIGMKLNELIRKNQGQLRSQQIVKSVSLCYNLSRLQVLQSIKSSMVDKFQSQVDQGTSLLNQNGQAAYSSRFSSLSERISFINDCQLILGGQFARDNSFLFSVTHFVGHAFISFQYVHYKQHIQQMFYKNKKVFNYNGNYLEVEEASYPSDVYWENIKILPKDRKKRIILTNFVLAMLLAISIAILIGLQILKQYFAGALYSDFINLNASYSLVFIIVLSIKVINNVLDHLSKYLTQYEMRKTRTDFTKSLFLKYFAAKLLNTVFIYFFVALIFNQQANSAKFMERTGLVLQITSFIIISGVLDNLKSLIFPKQLWKRFLRWIKYRKIENSVENKFQVTLNKQFQLPQFNMAKKYSNYLVMLYTSLFYSYLVPIGVPVIIVIIFLQYWIDKITLFKRSSLKFHFNQNLSIYVSKIFESSLLIFALGNFIFSYVIHNSIITPINIVSFIIAVLFLSLIWIAPRKLYYFVFGQFQNNQKYLYDDCVYDGKFQSTYWSQNPATFLIQEEKVTGKRKPVNPALNRLSKQSGVFLSNFSA